MGKGRFKVVLSPQSLRDLEEIVRYIAADNPPAADRFGQRQITEAEETGSLPFAGRVVPEFDETTIRERIHRSYRIVYRVRGNSLDITSSRKCPAQVWLQGRQPNDVECVNESFVSRAICQ